jgi:hypothetical protein
MPRYPNLRPVALLLLLLLLVLSSRAGAEGCAAPAAGAGDTIVFLNAYEGGLFSTRSLAGQDTLTTVVRVTATAGTGQLYIVAAAGTSVIWQVDGDASRISRFIAAGPAARGQKETMAGVAGLAAAKVSIVKLRDCIPVLSPEADSAEARQAALSLQAMAGRAVTASGAAVTVMNFGITPDGTVDVAAGTTAGTADLKPADIVSDATTEAYDVLPREAGLAQLAEEKKIVKTDDGYKIVKNVPRYPAGLTGSHAVRFLLAEGVKPPAGDPGHSCVRRAETDQPLNARIARNCR